MKAKKILSLALALMMLLGIVNIPAFATETIVAKIGDESYVTLADAVKAAQDGEVISVVSTGTYTLPSFGKKVTIKGSVEGVAIDMSKAVTLAGAKVTFENLTFNYGNNNYIGLHHVAAEIYNDCIINGQMFAYGDVATFTGCTFNQTSPDAYNLWTYGADVVTFTDCTFNSAGKSVLVYNEGGNPQEADFTNCEFIASQEVAGKAAIEIDSTFCEFTVNTDEATTATGFATGSVSGNSLWNVKKNSKDTLVSVNDTVVYTNVLPTATVTDITAADLKAGSAPALTFAKKFYADDVEQAVLDFYGDWYADFVLTLNKDATFNANGKSDGYLAGQYDAWSENWVSVPFEDVTLKAGESLKIMEYAASLMGQSGLKYKYAEVYEYVKEFDCGIFFDADYLLANPDLEVTLELRIYNNEDETESYSIGNDYDFTAPEIVARIDDVGYADLQTAIDDANGKTVTLLADITVDSIANAVNYTGGVSFTLDFNGKTLTANTTNSGVRFNINNDTVTAPVEITIKNGTINAGSSAYCALIAAGKSEDVTLTVNVENMTMTNCHNYGFNVKAFAYATVNVKEGTKIVSTDGQGGVYATNGSVVNVYDGAEIIQQDTATTYMGANIGVSGTGVVNVYGGTFTSDKYNANVMSSGGTLNILDGTFTSAAYGVKVDSWDSNVAAPSVANISGGSFTAPTVVWVGAYEGEKYSATANITGGTFNGKLDGTYGGEQTVLAVSGGNFTEDPTEYLAEGYTITTNEDGTYGVKFDVDSYLFKIQFAVINMAKAEDGDYRCAFVSGIDSLDYKEVGFKFYYNGEQFFETSTKTVYDSLAITSTSGNRNVYTAEQFGAGHLFYLGAQFPISFDDKAIEYQPYAVTLDGEEIVGIKTALNDIYTLDN